MRGAYKDTKGNIQHGDFTWYYKDGKKKKEATYVNNHFEGKWKTYYEDGTVSEERKYNHSDSPSPEYKIFLSHDKNKKIAVKEGKGYYYSYYENGQISKEGLIESGLRTGEWKGFYDNGEPYYIENYKNETLKKGISYDSEGKKYSYKEILVNPAPKGSYTALYTKIKANLVYPNSARKNNIEGKVYIEVIVNKKGKLTKPKVLQSLGYGCDKAAIQAIIKTGLWSPSKHRGQARQQRVILPVVFKLG